MELHIERGRIKAVLPCVTGVVIRTDTETFTFPGCTVLPGFVDAHVHLVGVGRRLALPSLHSATSKDQCLHILSAAEPTDGWIQAMGWNQEQWLDASEPTVSDLDQLFPTIPVVCSRIDGHALWVNSTALKIAGIPQCSGVLVDNAAAPVWAVLPTPSDEALRQYIHAAADAFLSAGFTEVHDMDVSSRILGVMREMAEQGALPIRVQSFVSAQENNWLTDGVLPAGGEMQRTFGVKMYADGSLGSRGAALLEPYLDADTSGFLLLDSESIAQRCAAAIEAGWWSIAVHAIGDRAVREVLDAFSNVRRMPGGSDVLLRIEHAQHVHPSDVPRFAQWNVIASVQSTHAVSDAFMAEHRLGIERLKWAYRWKSLLEAGVHIIAGSDAPIEPVSAIRTLTSFVNRIPLGMSRPWQPQEAITIGQALKASTEWAHAAADVLYRRGSLAVGMDADLVIVDRNPEHIAAEELSEMSVVATFTAGIIRYRHP